MKTITVKEAIEQGYKYFVYDGMGDQILNYLTDLSDEDYDNGPVLCNKEPTHPSCPDSKDFMEMIIDYLYDSNSDDCYFDREMFEDALKDMDFTGILSEVSEKLKGLNYYKGIQIKLVRE